MFRPLTLTPSEGAWDQQGQGQGQAGAGGKAGSGPPSRLHQDAAAAAQ